MLDFRADRVPRGNCVEIVGPDLPFPDLGEEFPDR